MAIGDYENLQLLANGQAATGARPMPAPRSAAARLLLGRPDDEVVNSSLGGVSSGAAPDTSAAAIRSMPAPPQVAPSQGRMMVSGVSTQRGPGTAPEVQAASDDMAAQARIQAEATKAQVSQGYDEYAAKQAETQIAIGEQLIDLEERKRETDQLAKESKERTDRLNKEVDELGSEPYKFFSSRPAFSKIMMGISVIADAMRRLSPNYDGKQIAMPMIERMIDRDMAAQEAMTRSKMAQAASSANALSVYRRELGDMDRAKTLLKAQKLDIAANGVRMMGDKLQMQDKTEAIAVAAEQRAMALRQQTWADKKGTQAVTMSRQDTTAAQPQVAEYKQQVAEYEKVDDLYKRGDNKKRIESIDAAALAMEQAGTVIDLHGKIDTVDRLIPYDTNSEEFDSAYNKMVISAVRAASGANASDKEGDRIKGTLRPTAAEWRDKETIHKRLKIGLSDVLKKGRDELDKMTAIERAAMPGGRFRTDENGRPIVSAQLAKAQEQYARAQARYSQLFGGEKKKK